MALVGENPVHEVGRIYQEAFGSKVGMWRWSFYGAYSPPELGQKGGVAESREAAEGALAAHWAKWLDWRRANPDHPPKVWNDACLHWPDGKRDDIVADYSYAPA